jgi:FixJ family two-component response regulator
MKVFRSEPPDAAHKLTPRRAQVSAMVLDGHARKNMALGLKITQRMVDNHRTIIIHRMEALSLPALTRTALCVLGNTDFKPTFLLAKMPGEN